MSANRYFEFDSTYRDRNQYPNPASFVVEISQSGQPAKEYSRDPVSNVSPLQFWNNSFLETTATNSTNGAGGSLAVDTTFSPTDPSYLKVTLNGGGQLRQIKDFYAGAILRITVGGTSIVQRILTYEPINTTTALIRLYSPLPNGVITADGVIENPTPLPTNTASSVIKFFIPQGSYIDNYYNNYIIQALGTTVTAENLTITSYDGTTKLATLSSATINDWSSNGNANENFILRKELPNNSGSLLAVSTNGFIVQLALSASQYTDSYNSSFLRMIEPVPTAVGGFSNNVAPYSEERKINKYISGNGTFTAFGGAGTNTFTLDLNNSSSVDNYYVDSFITNVNTGETRQVATYSGTTHSGTVTANWGAGAVGNSWSFRTAFLSSPFSTNPVVGVTDAYELEQYTRDNSVPFVYTGSLTSSQELVCYEIELLNLILPNITLNSGRGGRPAFYPYLYVQLEAISTGGLRNIIYSNNPNSTKMMFRAVVDDTPTPLISPFIKIDGNGMVHTLKFKPNDSFKFGVYHADGQLFTTEKQDTISPQLPDPLVQISACFAFKRV
jgi:hypothetical protein